MDILLEPTVFASVVISLLIAMLSNRLANFGEFLIAHVSLLPVKVRNRIRVVKWRRKKKIILTIRNHHKVTRAIIRSYTLLIFFFLTSVLYMFLITTGPLKGMGSFPSSIQLLITSPIYLFEVLWLLQRDEAQTLIKVADKRLFNR